MGSFTEEIVINQPVEAVWDALADIGTIYRWNPGVIASHVTSADATGLGAARHCELGGANYLKEEVVAYEIQRRLTMRIVETNMPFETADIQFSLHSQNGSTRVLLTPVYKIKFGPLGALLDTLYVRKTYQRGMKALLRGLKDHLEEIP